MDSIKLIFVIATITIFMVNADTKCRKQIIHLAKFKSTFDKTEAFERAYNELTVPANRSYQKSYKGIRYEYQDHLYSAAFSIYTDELLVEPIKWCIFSKRNLDYSNDMVVQDQTDYEKECKEIMTEAGYLGTAQQALHHSFYRLENTYAKSPIEFCKNYKPPAFPIEQAEVFECDTSQQYIQQPAHQSNRFKFDLNAQPSGSTFSEQPGEYYSSYHNQASTTHLNTSGNLGLDLNQLPPAEYNENAENNENKEV